MPAPFILVFYGLMTLLGWALATYWGEFNVLRWPGVDTELTWQVGLGVGVGLATVALSQWLDRVAEWSRRLNDGFREMLGPMNTPQIANVAVCSGVGEEVLFRGFLQQMLATHALPEAWAVAGSVVITSLAFGLMHIGPDWKTFWPWTVMAVVMGAVFGVLFVVTGSLLAPILAHLTINFFNLTLMYQDDTG